MALLLFLLLIAVPVAELWVIAQIADGIGLLPTLLLLFGVSIAGAWLLKRQGMATWRRMRESLRRGEMPAKEATDGALILLGGALLLTPGFLTDAVGLVLLFPVSRGALKGVVRRFMRRRIDKRWGTVSAVRRVHEARVVNVERTRPPSSAPARPDQLPYEPRPSDAGGSPDTG